MNKTFIRYRVPTAAKRPSATLAGRFRRTATLVFRLFSLFAPPAWAQNEHVSISHPVYEVLSRWEALKILPPDFSLTSLPLRRGDIAEALKAAKTNVLFLSPQDAATLNLYAREFDKGQHDRSVVFSSRTDSIPLLFGRITSDDEKLLFHYADTAHTVSIVPLGGMEARLQKGYEGRSSAFMAEMGARAAGTLGGALGFSLQVTYGRTLGGTPSFLFDDSRLAVNTYFRDFNAIFYGFTEAHLRFEHDWFYAILSRERRQIGAGYFTRTQYSDNVPVADAVSLGARFKGFEYRWTHFSLLGVPEPNPRSSGAGTQIPSKFLSYHRGALRADWGEVGVSEYVVYSRRGMDMAYLMPLGFLRIVADDLRDRDNYQLGIDVSLRPWRGIEFKSNFILDDLRMPEVGRGWWANKWAWNTGVLWVPSSSLPFDVRAEYARVEPYTFSHFDAQNAATHDGGIFAGALQPNSDEITLGSRFWWGGRYPIAVTASYRRHGANIMDEQGRLVRNVGGNVNQTLRYDADNKPIDSERVTFLEGYSEQIFTIRASAGMELARQWNAHIRYQFKNAGGAVFHQVALVFRFDDF